MRSETDQSLPAWRRIRQHTEFERAFHADRRSNKWFIAYARKNDGKLARLGLVVSKKVMPKAVTRNYAKRMIREEFRQNFPTGYPLDIIVRPKCSINPKNSIEGRLALKQLLLALQA